MTTGKRLTVGNEFVHDEMCAVDVGQAGGVPPVYVDCPECHGLAYWHRLNIVNGRYIVELMAHRRGQEAGES